jgi:hypothetical protein
MSEYCDCIPCCNYVSYENNVVSSKTKRKIGRYLANAHQSNNQTSSRLNTLEKRSGVITIGQLRKVINDKYGNWSVKINEDNYIYFQHNVFTEYLCYNEEELITVWADLKLIENESESSSSNKRRLDNLDNVDSDTPLRKKIRAGDRCRICFNPLSTSINPIILQKCKHIFCLTCLNSMGNKKCSFCDVKYGQKDIIPVTLYVSNSPSSIIDITTPSSSPPRELQTNLSKTHLNDMFKGFLKQNLEDRQKYVNNYYKMGIEIGMSLEEMKSNVSKMFDNVETELINEGISEENNRITEISENSRLLPTISEPTNLELWEMIQQHENKIKNLENIVNKGKYVDRSN